MASRRKVGKLAAEIGETIDREDADAAAIGQDGEPLARKPRQMTERLGGGEQFVEIEHAQETGTAERGVINRVGSGQRPVCVSAALAPAAWRPDLIDEHGLGSRRRPRRRHELARVLDRFDVKQDRARARGRCAKWSSRSAKSTSMLSPMETIAEKPMPRSAAHSTRPVAMAPDCEMQRQIAGLRHRRREAGIELAPPAPERRGNWGRPGACRLRRAACSHWSASEPGPWPRPAVRMMAARACPWRRRRRRWPARPTAVPR